MTFEEMQTTMQFILEQQAQFSVNIQNLTENMQNLTKKVDKLVDDHESLRRIVGAIAVAQANTEANLARTEKNVARLESNLARTDENLNALILTVEKYLGDRHNGQS